MKYTINVTQEDIDKGTPLSCKFCPISQAVRRISGALWTSSDVDWIAVGVNPTIKSDRYRTPQNAADFIRVFDASPDAVQPFSFELQTFGDPS